MCEWRRGKDGAVRTESSAGHGPEAGAASDRSPAVLWTRGQQTFSAKGQSVNTVGFASPSLSHLAVFQQTALPKARSGPDSLEITCDTSAAVDRTQQHLRPGSQPPLIQCSLSPAQVVDHEGSGGGRGQPRSLPPFQTLQGRAAVSLLSPHWDHTSFPGQPQWGKGEPGVFTKKNLQVMSNQGVKLP